MPSVGETLRGPAGAERRPTAFSVTCNLLSQYIKEKRGSGAGISIAAMASDPGKSEGLLTMNLMPGAAADDHDGGRGNKAADLVLFPQRAVSVPTPPPAVVAVREPVKSQLTMFYGGMVMVFDNFPADKARELMQLAGKGVVPAGQGDSAASAAATAVTCPQPNSVNAPAATTAVNQLLRVSHPMSSDMPIARSASIQRFLLKRKERVTAKSPYHKPIDSPPAALPPPPLAKMEEHGIWMGLGTGQPVKKEMS